MNDILQNIYRNPVLNKCYFRTQYKIDPKIYTDNSIEGLSATDVDKMVKVRMLYNFVKLIIKTHPEEIKKVIVQEIPRREEIFELSLIVLRLEDFKTIIEAVIQEMPMDTIKAIKERLETILIK